MTSSGSHFVKCYSWTYLSHASLISLQICNQQSSPRMATFPIMRRRVRYLTGAYAPVERFKNLKMLENLNQVYFHTFQTILSVFEILARARRSAHIGARNANKVTNCRFSTCFSILLHPSTHPINLNQFRLIMTENARVKVKITRARLIWKMWWKHTFFQSAITFLRVHQHPFFLIYSGRLWVVDTNSYLIHAQ